MFLTKSRCREQDSMSEKMPEIREINETLAFNLRKYG